MRFSEKKKNFLINYARPFIRENRKSLSKILIESIKLYRIYGAFPDQYFRLGLYSKDFSENVDQYMPKSIVYKLQLKLNGKRFPPQIVDKRVFRKIMQDHGVACVVELFSTDGSGRPVDLGGQPISLEMARRDIMEAGGRAFVKPLNGMGGQGSSIIDLEGDEFYQIPERLPNYLFQPVLSQHEIINRIYSKSINTVRIDTLLIDGECQHSCAVLRIGSGGEIVDNAAKGGFVVPVNLKTGALGSVGRHRPQYGLQSFTCHPDTGVQFASIELPFWDELLDLVKKAAFAMHPLATLGWDVAITPTGPVIVEANGAWGTEIFQLARGLRDTPIGQMALRESRRR